MRKKSREMDEQWALVLPLRLGGQETGCHQGASPGVSLRRVALHTYGGSAGKRKQYDKNGKEMKYGRME